MNKTRQQRTETVNKIIQEISARDRKFFKSGDITAFFSIDPAEKLYFFDEYTKKQIPMLLNNNVAPRDFNHGGTMWGLINDFKEFIETGEHTTTMVMVGFIVNIGGIPMKICKLSKKKHDS